MTTSPAYQLLCNLLVEVDGWGRIAREQWLDNAGIEHLKAYLPPDLPPLSFAPAVLDATFQQGNDYDLRLMVTALQVVVAGHPDHLEQVNALLVETDLIKAVFPNGRIVWAEDRATTLAVAKAYFNQLPTDKVPAHVSLPDVPFPPKSHMPFVANPDFVGREAELMAITEGIKTGQGAVVAAGIGGVGKTQLAVEWVHRYGRYFAGGVFWLDFSNEGSIPLSIASAGAAYQHPHYAQMELADQVRWVREQWKAETPTLLIFDNCEEPKLADEYAPIGSGARVLVTSRDQTMAQTIRAGTMRPVSIETLPRPDSINLLQRLRPDLSDSDANAIAEELGDLPLAIHIAGSFLQQYRTTSYGTPTTYLERLRQPDLLEQLGRQGQRLPDLPTKHERDVARTFLISIERLDADTRHDPFLTRIVLLLIAQFAPGVGLPSAWLKRGLTEDLDELDGADALKRLLAVGLVDTPQESMVRIHHLVARVVTEIVPLRIKTDAVTQSENIILAVKPEYGQVEFMLRMDVWLPHARHMASRAIIRRDERAALLANNLGYRLNKLALYNEVAYWYEESLDIRRNLLGANHPYTATSLNNLALLYKLQGEYERALPLYQEALSIRRETMGVHHPDTAQSLHNLASLYHEQGAYERALPLYEQALRIRRKVLVAHHPDIAITLNNLAGLHYTKGQYEHALPLYEEALEIRREVLGARHPDTAISLNNLAGLYKSQGEYERALPLYLEALAISREVLGARHPNTAISLNNLAGLYKSQGEYERALPLYQKVVSIFRESLGTLHPYTAISLMNLARLYHLRGEYEYAVPFYEEALAIRQNISGIRHFDTAQTLSELADLYKSQGEYKRAMPLYEEALSILAEVSVPNLDEPIIYNNLAELYYEQGSYEVALHLFQEAVWFWKKLGIRHPYTAISLNYQAILYCGQGLLESALSCFEEAVAISIEQLGIDHPNTTIVLENRDKCQAMIEDVSN